MLENMTTFFNNIWHTRIISSIIIIAVSVILYKGVSHFLTKGEKSDKLNLFNNKKSKTYLKLIKSVIRYIFIAVTVLIVLQVNGVDVSSVLAGVGIAGVVIGLAIQDWLKDIIRGSSILSDSYFAVGDIVKYKEMEGQVLAIGLKTTKLQDLKTNNILSIANRNIEEIEVVSNVIYVNVPISYEIAIEKAEKVIADMEEAIKKNNHVSNCKYVGVTELEDSCIEYCLEITCNQRYKRQVRRDALGSILRIMEDHNIAVPYPQIDIHTK